MSGHVWTLLYSTPPSWCTGLGMGSIFDPFDLRGALDVTLKRQNSKGHWWFDVGKRNPGRGVIGGLRGVLRDSLV